LVAKLYRPERQRPDLSLKPGLRTESVGQITLPLPTFVGTLRHRRRTRRRTAGSDPLHACGIRRRRRCRPRHTTGRDPLRTATRDS
jgi:hypothetical protein